MPKLAKFAIGLVLALGVGAVAHGPLGQGQAFVDRLDADLQRLLAYLAVPGVAGSVQREPLARTALLAGPANCFQRRGDASFGDGRDGTYPGIEQRVVAIPGMARFIWSEPPPGGEQCR